MLRPTMPVFRVMTLVYLMFAAILLYVAIAWQKPWMYAFAAISLVIFVVKNGRYGFLAFLRRSVSQA